MKRAARFLDPPCVWQAYFDGGSRGNPGIAGSGACVIVNGAEVASAVQGCRHGSTNNEAECIGAALALRLLSALLEAVQCGRANVPPPSSIEVLGDSKLIINQVQGIWAVRAKNLTGPVCNLRQLASDLHVAVRAAAAAGVGSAGPGLQWQHVKRDLNKRADHLSNLAMDSAQITYRPPFAPVCMFSKTTCPHLRSIVGDKTASVVWTDTAAIAQKFLEDEVLPAAQAGSSSAPATGQASAAASYPAHSFAGDGDSSDGGEYTARRPAAGEVMTQQMAHDILYEIYPDVSTVVILCALPWMGALGTKCVPFRACLASCSAFKQPYDVCPQEYAHFMDW